MKAFFAYFFFVATLLPFASGLGLAQTASQINELLEESKSIPSNDSEILSIGRKIAEFKKEALPVLIKALKSEHPRVRHCSAWAFFYLHKHYDKEALGLDLALECTPLIDALSVETDNDTAGTMAYALLNIKPAPSKAVPVLIEALSRGDFGLKREIVGALGSYEANAVSSKPTLLQLCKTNKRLIRYATYALEKIGMSKADAEALCTLNFSSEKWPNSPRSDMSLYAPYILRILVLFPDQALIFLKNHQGLLKYVGDARYRDTLVKFLKENAIEGSELLSYLYQREDLPAILMVYSGKSGFLPVIEKRMKEAYSHKRSFLEACARGLGAKPKKIVKISDSEEGDFRPRSALGTETNRGSGGAHGDGVTEVLITGRILMSDGTPAVDPVFLTKGPWTWPSESKKAVPINYDPKTGRFFFLTELFAAYAFDQNRKEPGPYQTGPAEVLIKAKGAKPLLVNFWDEMPDVEIALTIDK